METTLKVGNGEWVDFCLYSNRRLLFVFEIL